MGRSTVRVVARLRPTDHFGNDVIQLMEDQKTVNIHTSRRSGNDVVNNAQENQTFKLDTIFKDASQETLYETCAVDIVKSVVAGYNGTLMAYGQTGAGKTYTMMGGSDYRTRGIIPRAIKQVFDEVTSQVDKQFEIRVSYIEVYLDRICDLLAPNSDEDISIQEDAKGTITIKGALHTHCTHEADALSLLFTGNNNRAVAEHALNSNSSRSHCIFTLHVTSRSRVESESASLVGKLHCIDLAGSERLSKTASGGKLMKEAQYINKSLTFLEQVVMALGSSNRAHVPFRQSKLTNILKDSLGGNSKTTMIANIWPEERHTEETVSTLKFAARMSRVHTEASVNVNLDPETHIKQLQRKINDLKSELQMQNQLMGKSHIVYEGEIGEDERFEMEKTVRSYVGGKTPEIPVRSLREVKEYFRIFKAFVDSKEADRLPSQGGQRAPEAPVPVPQPPVSQKRRSIGDAGVGVVDGSGLSLGVAAPAKSLREVVGGPQRGTSIQSPGGPLNSTGVESVEGESPERGHFQQPMVQPDRNVAFQEYKLSDGSKVAQMLKENQDQLALKRKRASELSLRVNDIKSMIDAASAQLEQKRLDRQARGEEELVDNEEFEIVKRVKEHKLEYRHLYDELTTTKTTRDHLVKLVDHAKQQLLSGFEQWFIKNFQGSVAGAGSAAASALSGTWAARPPLGRTGRSVGPDEDDALDEGEKFELLELNRVMDEDPDSVAYYQAKKMITTRNKKPGVVSPHRRR